MNITDRLAETMFAPSCGRCGVQQVNREGWRKSKLFDWNSKLITQNLLCPACVTDYGWFMETPPENPDTDSVSSTDVPKGAT